MPLLPVSGQAAERRAASSGHEGSPGPGASAPPPGAVQAGVSLVIQTVFNEILSYTKVTGYTMDSGSVFSSNTLHPSTRPSIKNTRECLQ